MVDVDESPDGQHRAHADRKPREIAPLATRNRGQPPEQIRPHRNQVVSKRVENAPRRGRAVEPVRRKHRIQDDERGVDDREPIGGPHERKPSRAPERCRERKYEQRLLPRGDGVERQAVQAGIPQLGHDQVVKGEADHERGEREPR